jgi:hypothetical protein
MPSPLTSLTTMAQRGQRRRQTNPPADTETTPVNPVGRAGAIGFLAEKMIGGLAKKKRLANSQPPGLSQQTMGESPLSKDLTGR